MMSLPEDVWRSNSDYMALVDTGTDPTEARRQIATDLAQNAAIASGVVSIGLNKLPGADYLERAMAGVKLPGASRLANTARGFVGETVQEGGEEAGGAIAANLATGRIDPSQIRLLGGVVRPLEAAADRRKLLRCVARF